MMLRYRLRQAVLIVAGTLAVLISSWAAENKGGRKYALVVGINRYDHARLSPLQYAVNDAQKLGEVLAQQGFTVTLLTDEAGKTDAQRQPTKQNIERRLDEMLKKCQREDLVVVALAGHGLRFEKQTPGDPDDGYFCPKDARPVQSQTATLVSLKRVYQLMENSLARTKVVLVDACRAEPDKERGTTGITGSAAGPGAQSPKGIAVLFSCRAGERAYEDAKLKHGVFFYYIIRGLQGAARNQQKQVTFGGLAAYVKSEVPGWIRGNLPEGKQSPSLVADYAAEPLLVGIDHAPEPGAKPPATSVLPGGSDWPRFLGPTGDSISSERGIIAPWPRDGLRIVWHVPVGVGYGMPVISGGRLFQFDRRADQARLSCLNSETGKFLWKFEYPTTYRDRYGYNNGPRCCPVVDGDRVYLFGVEGMLHCVRATDGTPLWKVDTSKDFGVEPNFFGVGSTPVVVDDLLIVQVGGSKRRPDGGTVPSGSGVVAFDKLSGKVRYQIANELASYSSPVVATIGDRRWCFVFARGGLIGFEPASGKIDFHYPWRAPIVESVNASNPVVVGNRVLISETYGPGTAVLQVPPGETKVIWSDAAAKPRDKSLQCHWNTPIHHKGYVYGSSGRHSETAELRCIELATGKVMWRKRGLGLSSLLMVDKHFICLTEEGLLLLLKVNPERYEEVSRLDLHEPGKDTPLLEYPCWAAPILSHGLLYVRGKDRLVCLELIPRKR